MGHLYKQLGPITTDNPHVNNILQHYKNPYKYYATLTQASVLHSPNLGCKKDARNAKRDSRSQRGTAANIYHVSLQPFLSSQHVQFTGLLPQAVGET